MLRYCFCSSRSPIHRLRALKQYVGTGRVPCFVVELLILSMIALLRLTCKLQNDYCNKMFDKELWCNLLPYFTYTTVLNTLFHIREVQ